MPDYKNRFLAPEYEEFTIVEDTAAAAKVGTVRIKPSSLLWKPVNARSYYSVPWDKLEAWIKENGSQVDR